jgi:hypothetical protein
MVPLPIDLAMGQGRYLWAPTVSPRHPNIGHSVFLLVVASVDVLPIHAQVALLDASWLDRPEWYHCDEDAVWQRGFAVATRPGFGGGPSATW